MLSKVIGRLAAKGLAPSEQPARLQPAVKPKMQHHGVRSTPTGGTGVCKTDAIRAGEFYPPVDPGIALVPTREILQAPQNVELLARLHQSVSCDQETWFARYLAPIEALASYIHLLPASGETRFAGAGGLFRLSLEVAFYSVQAAGQRIFTPTADVQTRHRLEPRYKYATFLAGLCSQLYRPLAEAVVADASGTKQWSKFLGPLDEWGAQAGLDRYYVTWPKDGTVASTRSEASAVIGRILPREALTWIDEGSPAIVRDLHAVALGQARDGDSTLADVVLAITAAVVKRDDVTRATRYGRLTVGHQLEIHALDVIRTLVASGTWPAHGPDAMLAYGTDGCYLKWPMAHPDFAQEVLRRGLQGYPQDAATIEDMLGRAGALVRTDAGRFLWEIVDEGKTVTALRFVEPYAVLGYAEIAPKAHPYAAYLVNKAAAQTPAGGATGAAGRGAAAAATTAASQTDASLSDEPAVSGYAFPASVMASQLGTEQAAAPAEPEHSQASGQSTQARQQQEAHGEPDAGGRAVAPMSDGEGEATGDAHGQPPSPPAPADGATRTKSQAARTAGKTIHEVARRALRDEEVAMAATWRDALQRHRNELVIELTGGDVAISANALPQGLESMSSIVAMIEKRGWLGHVPGAPKHARAGNIQFGDGSKPGFVINAEGAQLLGLKA